MQAAQAAKQRLPDALFEAAETIHSDGDRQRLLSMVLSIHGDDPATVTRVLRTAASMSAGDWGSPANSAAITRSACVTARTSDRSSPAVAPASKSSVMSRSRIHQCYGFVAVVATINCSVIITL